MELPEPVRLLARNPFRELPGARSTKFFELHGAKLGIAARPGPVVAFPWGDDLDVEGSVEAARTIVREHNRSAVAWWLVPEHVELYGPRFQALGIVNADAPGFEAVENGLALVEPPIGERVEGIEVQLVETFEQYVPSLSIFTECFGLPELSDDEKRVRFEEYIADDAGRAFIASVDGVVAGAASVAFAAAGLNLFGGAVLPESRGRGVYRSLLFGRWDYAVARGTPALTVQAGRMSRPICDRLGFQFVDAARVYVDSLS
jgi:hypothetical protein